MQLTKVCGDSASSFVITKYWTAEFENGRTRTFYDIILFVQMRVTLKNVWKIHDIVINNRRAKANRIAETVDRLIQRVHNI